jgi:AraC-like DNA-binding protein/mannose-6-phosphate isomerase-like protein (cupin superfamily)
LLQICGRRRFEPHRIGHLVDKTGRYNEALDREFPFLIRLFRYTSRRHTPGMTWHERLELFLPLDGTARFQMGDEVVELGAGDLLVVDNLKLHRVLDFPGFNTRVIVVSFMPEFVYSLGSPSHDYAFLLPFYAKVEKRPHVVRTSDALAGAVYQTLGELVACYFERPPFFQAGCKAICLRLLHHLATRFQTSEILKSEFLQQQERSRQLTRLLDHISQHYAERLTLTEAARMAGMSPPKFTKVFKRVAGMTLVNYVTHVRLSHAARLLRETTRSVAEIASAVGFADQSYFDRRFRGSFGQTPLRYRSGLVGRAPVSNPGQDGGGQ